MADYKGGEIFIDLGGIDVEKISTSTINRATVNGLYSRLEMALNLGKRIVITNYKSQYSASSPIENGVPASVTLYRPVGTNTQFYIPVLTFFGIAVITITNSDIVSVYKMYTYHNIYTPPETTTNNARNIDETIEETEKGEESK